MNTAFTIHNHRTQTSMTVQYLSDAKATIRSWFCDDHNTAPAIVEAVIDQLCLGNLTDGQLYHILEISVTECSLEHVLRDAREAHRAHQLEQRNALVWQCYCGGYTAQKIASLTDIPIAEVHGAIVLAQYLSTH